MLLKQKSEQTLVEEVLNSASHGIGIGLSISALIIMTAMAALQSNPYKIVAATMFGTALIAMYTASTLYHSLHKFQIKKLFRIFDHACIYLLIAGTYTPFTLVSLHGDWGWSLFGVIWGIAFCGVIFKIFFINKFNVLSTAIYLLMGWLVIIAIKPICHELPLGGIVWLFLGGISYTIGVVFYLWEKLRFSHTIWHLFVLGGSICHFFCVLFYVIR